MEKSGEKSKDEGLSKSEPKKEKKKSGRVKISLRYLSKELSKKPEILKYILDLQKSLLRRKKAVKEIKVKLKSFTKKLKIKKCDVSCQVDENTFNGKGNESEAVEPAKAWEKPSNGDEGELSIADQVKQAAESALEQTGMVYEATSGMYYDYTTGYYYNAEHGLYYHDSTGSYYYYDKENNNFIFHSQVTPAPSTAGNALTENNESSSVASGGLQKKVGKHDNAIDILSASLAAVSLGRRSALESVSTQYPPCMRIIVQETNIEKMKVGSLFLLTKDGGTLGREGDQHSVLIPEENVSRHHLTFSYNEEKKAYFIVDMGSRNGTILNGKRISPAQQESQPVEVVHGSVIQLGSTKLLCHIHVGNNTCGHCEPGLLIQDKPKEDAIKTTMKFNKKKEYQKELQKLKQKYAVRPVPPEEMEGQLLAEGYEDKAQKRREKVGSQHHGAKTEQASIDTTIASTNKGFKMLEKMGWSAGEGLGKTSQGKSEPIPLVSNPGKSGLRTSDEPGSIVVAALPSQRKVAVRLAMQKRFQNLVDKPASSAFIEDEDSSEEEDKK